MLGPRINAGGRIGQADLGARLLFARTRPMQPRWRPSSTASTASARPSRWQRSPKRRRRPRRRWGSRSDGAVVVTASPRWHPGVVGLVAARLKERFGRPAFAIALGPGGPGTGSGRSIAGVDLGRAVRHAVADGLLEKGGGHAMAAGVTLKADALNDFRAFLEEHMRADVEAARARMRC